MHGWSITKNRGLFLWMEHHQEEEESIIPHLLPPSTTTGSSSSNNNKRYRFRRWHGSMADDRIARALSQPLRLLHRMDPLFFVLGSTGNVYIVTIASTPCCSCPDPTTPCKHIFFILICVLATPLLHHPSITTTIFFYPKQLCRLLATPTSPDSFAGRRLRRIFLRLFFHDTRWSLCTPCPICLDNMLNGVEPVVVCYRCRNGVHRKCMTMWMRKGANKCVMCRAEWSGMMEQESYINLAAYGDGGISDDERDPSP